MSDRALALVPGSTIGILGGGQLGRMMALAAANLGYRCHIFTPEDDSPASLVSARTTVARWDDRAALEAFAGAVDVITLEFENVPTEAVDVLNRITRVSPGAGVLAVAQDRLMEKQTANRLGIATAPFRPVDGPDDLRRAMAEIGPKAILKTRRLGYDGKGQVRITADSDAEAAFAAIGSAPAILEGFVDFTTEISVIAARRPTGEVLCFPPAENSHKDGILDTSRVPAGIGEATRGQAIEMAATLAKALDVIGLLAVEMFVGRDGVLAMNEMAPRPHNSGHWTQDFCRTSQFEQAVRAVTGLPLGPVDVLEPAEMHNLIGHDVDRWPELVSEAGAKLHLYGKTETRAGRKMGHVNRPWRQKTS